ncbi:PIN domain-containing protein [Hymenobacter sp. M29]|uniref:PIN domain-containing protein n=1 Tax=Hymenobacter mellowenesis TaxID=3063995 RepID=A0ABT9AC41_9BACT|nr:PIN domain-containing protein [Hymenobacter sp. M29]MDO7846919.1 PIN domain-containing protein [Hymenobacter sp. M29]
MKHLFLDTNILIDLLSGREPFGAVALFAAAHARQMHLFASGLSISTCHYILERHHPQLNGRALVRQLLPLLTITEVSATVIQQALDSAFADFEDGLQYYLASSNPLVEVIVTRNVKDFLPADIPVIEPTLAVLLA